MKKGLLLLGLAAASILLISLVVWRRGAPQREIANLVNRLDQGENYLTNADLRKLVIQHTTQAVEHALLLINKRDSSWKKLAMELDRKITQINFDWDTESVRGFKASKVFFVLGQNASGFIPKFGELLQDSRLSFYGQFALIFAGESAIPTLTNLFNHASKRVRADAAFACMKNQGNRGFTTQWTEAATGKTIYAPAPTLSDEDMRALGRMLKNPNASARRAAAEALERHSGIGRVAVPALHEALSDSDPAVRTAVKAALDAIAPGQAQ
jgi:hypothetical protein